MSVWGSASATFSRCELVPPPTFASLVPFLFLGFVPYPGLIATSSNVFLYDTLVRGSTGASSHFEGVTEIPPGTSAPAVVLNGSTLLAVGSTLDGGSGGSGLGTCGAGASGSPGLRVESGGDAHLLGCSVQGGTGGAGSCGLPAGADAQDVEVVAGDVHDLPGAARSFHGASPIVEGTATNVHLEGEPGDAVLLHVQLAAAPGIFFPDFGCALHLPLPLAVVGLGVLPPSGVLDLAFPVPMLAPGVESFRAVGQALFIGATGFFEGGPSTLLIVDAAL